MSKWGEYLLEQHWEGNATIVPLGHNDGSGCVSACVFKIGRKPCVIIAANKEDGDGLTVININGKHAIQKTIEALQLSLK